MNAFASKELDTAILAPDAQVSEENRRLVRMNQAMARLVTAVQELSLARDLSTIMDIVRHAAREITGADGATFVLRDGDKCHYADEDAIAPLWKGQRFPLTACISGWVMLRGQPAVIEDIYSDPRIPADAYRPTFVKSLAMIPIRPKSPIAAIGNYWARRHQPTTEEVELLQALANTTSVAMENVQVYSELENRVQERTAQLEEANRELESFAHTVSHDLRAPLRSIEGYSRILVRQHAAQLSPDAREVLDRVFDSTKRMNGLIESLLCFSNVSRQSLTKRPVQTAALVQSILQELKAENPDRTIDIRVAELPDCVGDEALLRQVFTNLLSNALKFTRSREKASVEIGVRKIDGETVFFVADNGAGFDMRYAHKLFGVFQRLHTREEFEGTGVGLSIAQRILHRHGGRIWAEAEPDKGATFFVTIP